MSGRLYLRAPAKINWGLEISGRRADGYHQLRSLMQMEQLGPQGNVVRRMWVQRIKKMEERWMVRDMEVETLNSGHRTRLHVDEASAP